MANYLNIDELVQEKKVLTLKGVDYTMHVITVGEFIELMRDQKNQEDMDALPVAERVQKLVEQIQKAFPDIPTEHLTSLNLEQLTAIIKFVMGTLQEEHDAKTEAATGKKGKN
jgi:hypothetical protein